MKEDILLSFDPKKFYRKKLSEGEILHWFELCDAVWLHDGNPKKPHAELTSGMCSNGFFDCLRVLKYPNLSEILAQQLVGKLLDKLPRNLYFEGPRSLNWVVGSAYAAITFSYEVAKLLGATHGFVEKDPTDPKEKKMVWRRMTIPRYASVFQVEELITTSKTLKEVRRVVEEGNSEPVFFVPTVGALVHRPSKLPVDYGDFKIIALIEKEIWVADPKDCSLCKAGSPRYRPKTHWKELTGK